MKKSRFLIFLGMLLLFVNLLTGADTPPQVSNNEQTTTSQHNEEAALDKLITKFENGFFKFAEYVKLVFKKYERQINPKTLAALKEPLRNFILNIQNNKYKNIYKYYAMRKARGDREPYFKFDDNAAIYYAILPVKYRKHIAAGFMMQTRVLYLNPNYEPSSILDNLIVFHELVHSVQDTGMRNQLKNMGSSGDQLFAKYIYQLNHGIKNPDWEPIAYAMEIELFNILFKGKVRRLVSSGQGLDSSEDDIARLLKATTPEKRGALNTLLKYTSHYFRDNCWIYSYTREYRAIIIEDNIRMGMRFHASDDRYIRLNSARNTAPASEQPQHRTPSQQREENTPPREPERNSRQTETNRRETPQVNTPPTGNERNPGGDIDLN